MESSIVESRVLAEVARLGFKQLEFWVQKENRAYTKTVNTNKKTKTLKYQQSLALGVIDPKGPPQAISLGPYQDVNYHLVASKALYTYIDTYIKVQGEEEGNCHSIRVYLTPIQH